MRLQHRIMLALLDGRPRRLGDFAGYLLEHIDPAKTVRAYLRRGCNGRADAPIEHQLSIGNRYIIRAAAKDLADKGYVDFDWQSRIPLHDAVLRLTGKGREAAMQPQVLGAIAQEVKQLLQESKIEIRLYNNPGEFTS